MSQKVFISEDDEYLFGQGTHYDIYDKLGAHPSEEKGKKGFFFAVWAPNAADVHVVGDFNGWDENAHQMKRSKTGNIWTLFIPGVAIGALYKFLITAQDGRKLYKADPYANYAELRPGNASRTTDLSGFKWSDSKWYESLKGKDMNRQPIAIYECHIGSWMKHPDGTEDGFYTYRQFADRIVEYLKEMKYTHIELIGIAEHPFDGSWGYQVTGYYAPTARYGEPTDFMYLINQLHKHGIGVILDWVPAHFCPDEFGLACFDGTCIYEDPDPRKGEHPDWGTKIFNLAKPEVKNFLIANALYWIRKFHIDGLRVDAVASMLYLDYGKKDGQWVPNKYGDNKNLDAIEFFKHFNSVVRGTYPNILTIAEESTAWPKVTAPPEEDGLGFAFKWNMGWMHDFCEYMKLDPYFRQGAHYMMTFAMSYNDSENYILPLSHDEVVHLKCSMVEKMPGYKVDKYANLRVGYTYMFGHSGKKLLFMGQDFGQEREWSEKRELDWFLLENDLNRGMKDYVGKLLEIYRKYPALYEVDNDWGGFEWINADDKERSTYSFYRRASNGKDNILFVLNMTPMERKGFKVGVPFDGTYTKILDSAKECYGGSGSSVPDKIKAVKGLCDYKDYSIEFDLPPYGAEVFVFQTKKTKN
ncbi:1,4-alpha-glucan branching enzyme GlgB1 [Butyrivibrio proteoclasticus B316]|uniref:1,4-alpha-glucan branching enzyme GlgB n=2 Tax=Butyrivibrio TaxID=830 RepID=GLGB_BUTFI|nr:1,4-alpha-glucan branching protein GlgB [Butyrivibrio proteoclasticus]P30539.1 RecName: Full=1,4-alpha-glucan branching enzyme GlgB; AltName: Full=1,4-alpha-D-glucan:1,4-alpha-D-glucan 6-glucosyl-transferase; AltName: Full=Alpha-(1->4)-glucan branching enzyme; AltName: Full=Glycogen branching enzyme; Short=BE [Butyrivibrio fibrisolvens]AAA23007.1 1,4-glucan:1,4-glucan 6 glycosyltransferase [Butyrivibrio fibrisolvens]ADL32812.1 1,4-alpha-glucan branching enzyme GlgB1 [Butyrivibrio proteoclasti